MTKPLILFDLGGVLADLGRPAELMDLPMTDKAFWTLWLSSPAVQEFELGHIDAGHFFAMFSKELGLSESEKIFRQRFTNWHLDLFPAADHLLNGLLQRHDVALLSNTNPVHWQMVTAQSNAFDRFSHLFLSFEMGLCKPTDAAFQHVIDQLATLPSSVVFLDDTASNVTVARRFGMVAAQVRGVAEACSALAANGIDTSWFAGPAGKQGICN